MDLEDALITKEEDLLDTPDEIESVWLGIYDEEGRA